MHVSRLDFAVELWRLKFVTSAEVSKVFECNEWRMKNIHGNFVILFLSFKPGCKSISSWLFCCHTRMGAQISFLSLILEI